MTSQLEEFADRMRRAVERLNAAATSYRRAPTPDIRAAAMHRLQFEARHIEALAGAITRAGLDPLEVERISAEGVPQ